MPNNFKLRGDYYVSKAGNDANDGLTPETPKLTIQAGLNLLTASNRRLIIGSGVYKEQINFSYNVTGGNIGIISDGYVILEGDSTTFLSIVSINNGTTIEIIGIEFKNYNFVRLGNFASTTSQNHNIKGCIFKNTNIEHTQGASQNNVVVFLQKCQFINSIINVISLSGLNSNPLQISDSILINSKIISFNSTGGGLTVFRNSYIDSSSVIIISGTLVLTAVTFNFNNIQGKVAMPINGAVSGVNSNGVALSFAQHRIDYPTYNVNSFSSDPKFNNPRLLDFTLQAGSPNVSASSDYSSNIGGTEYAVPFTASSAAFTTNATSQSLEYRGNLYYAISGSATTGSITSGPMFLQWPRTKPLTSVNWIGALEFNKTITASLAGNNNVPAYTTFTSASGLAGANPDRLKIRLRYSTQQTQPATDAEWDNGGYWTAGTYQLFEPNTKPKVDYKGTGNGDPTYVETLAIGDLVPSWIQTEIILRNDYNR